MASSKEQKKNRVHLKDYDSSKDYPEGTMLYWEDNDEEEDAVTTEDIEAILKKIEEEGE